MPKNYLKPIAFLTAVLAVAGFYFLFFFNSQEIKDHSIVILESGFSPASLIVRKGDSVTFKTMLQKEFWPASDLHPTHGVYPEFDPKQPILPDSSWTFKFTKEGEWRFHDHLFPAYRGTITVKKYDGQAGSATTDCSSTDDKHKCWEDYISSALKTKGLDAAFEVLAGLYSSEPAFASECHGYVHKLGEAAYEKFTEHEDMDLTPKTSYCGYGFYHGFMETLLQSGGNIDQAREFCAYADNKLKSHTAKAFIACYHGIGHGAVDGSDPRAWGDPQKIVGPALKLCEEVSDNEKAKNLCGTGVFNGLAIAYSSGQFNLVQKGNPYEVCQLQNTSYFKNACYEEMNTRAMQMAGGDFVKAVKFVQEIKDQNYAKIAIENLSPVAVSGTNSLDVENEADNYDVLISVCRSAGIGLWLPCLGGLVGGLIEHGEPGREYSGSVVLCRSKMLNGEERLFCNQTLVGHANTVYPQEKVKEICDLIDEPDLKNCPA